MRSPACSDVKFRDQIRPGSCSGFLISPTVFVTAGHCVDDGIKSLRLVMNFVVPDPELATSKSLQVSRSQVYSFKRILATRFEPAKDPSGKTWLDSNGEPQYMDFAFLELDRPVEGADPFAIEIEPESRLGDPLLLLGHPAGLPLKYTAGGRLALDDGAKYYANYDSFGGNSGSLVMNLRTGKVIAIHTTGTAEDWSHDFARNCMRETRARDSSRPGGGMVKLSEVYKVLSASERAALTGRRETETPIPVSSGVRTCVIKENANGFEYFNSNPVFDRSDLDYVSAGARVEIIGEEPVYYQGSSHEGVRMRVLTSPGSSYAAKPGTLLWTYKVLLNCV